MNAPADPQGRPPSLDEALRALERWARTSPDAPPNFARKATLAQPRPVVKVVLGAHEAWLEAYPPDAVRALEGVAVRRGTREEAAAAWGVPAEILDQLGTPARGESYRMLRLPAWRVGWTFRGHAGSFWLADGDVVFPDPPRSRAPLVAAIGAGASLLLLAVAALWPQRQAPPPPPSPPPVAARPAPPPPDPEPPPPPPAPVARPIPDALVVLVGGEVFRGATTQEADVVRVRDWEREVEVDRWKVERIDPDAAISLRRHLKALEAFRRDVETLVSLPDASRATLADKLTEGFRLDDLWTRLKPLTKQGELPENLDPLDLLDRDRARLEALLKSPPLPAALPGVPVAPPPPAPPPAPPPPADADVREALAGLGDLLDPDAPPLNAVLGQVRERHSAAQSLVEVLHLLLMRGPRDWGLLGDRFLATAPDRKVDVECSLDAVTPGYLSGRLPSGSRVSGLKGADGRWTVRLPDREPFAAVACEGRKNAPSTAGESLRRHLQRLPPGAWAGATPEQHLDEARRLETEAPAALQASGPRAAEFLRMLAAAHAGTALDKAPADGGAAARARLAVMGWGPAGDGSWQRPSEAAASQMGAQLRDGRPDLAAGLLQDAPSGGFPAALRAATLRLRRPILTPGDQADLQRLLQRLQTEARSETERRHAEALTDSLGKDSRCLRCGGDATSTCTACRGRGQKLVFCGRCNGQGVLLRVGQGGGPQKCTGCDGRPGPRSESCKACGGAGKVSCRDCPPARRPPKPDEIAALIGCSPCQGRGRTFGRVSFGCGVCAGLGQLLVPAADPTALLR